MRVWKGAEAGAGTDDFPTASLMLRTSCWSSSSLLCDDTVSRGRLCSSDGPWKQESLDLLRLTLL